jgi:hypothetical protein
VFLWMRGLSRQWEAGFFLCPNPDPDGERLRERRRRYHAQPPT